MLHSFRFSIFRRFDAFIASDSSREYRVYRQKTSFTSNLMFSILIHLVFLTDYLLFRFDAPQKRNQF